MAFLDNSGDIILDAVLTDTGRFRLARGDGSFKIAKFALGDEEINYGSFNATHPSGSAYYDIEILQTPVLEAFTNNMSSMKSKLMTMANNNLLYLPVLKINDSANRAPLIPQAASADPAVNPGGYVVLCDDDTVKKWKGENIHTGNKKISDWNGVMNGVSNVGTNYNKPAADEASGGGFIRIDQGLNTTEISGDFKLDPELQETRFIIEMDNRLAKLNFPKSNKLAAPAFIDDDNIATYYVSKNSETQDFIKSCVQGTAGGTEEDDAPFEVITGPRGNNITFNLQASTELASSTYLFTQLGSTSDFGADGGTGGTPVVHYYVDSTIRVIGATTGARIDIPVRFIKVK